MKILVTPPANEGQRERLMAAAPGQEFTFCIKSELTAELLEQAEIILGNPETPDQLKYCRNLRWIQLNNAGTDGFCVPGILPEGAVLANATGAYGMAISEYMIGGLFELRKKLNRYYLNQQQHYWHPEGFVGIIEGSTVLCVGFGNIGSTFGRKMKALGCRVIGVNRRGGEQPEWLDGLYGMDQLDELLGQADVVALSLPGNEFTRHTITAERLAKMRKNAVLINVGRGPAVDTDALVQALADGTIAGAVLDVTDPEPLPPDHPLWDAPNAVITPHISGGFAQPETLDIIFRMFENNLRRYFSGQELEQRIDMETGYCL